VALYQECKAISQIIPDGHKDLRASHPWLHERAYGVRVGLWNFLRVAANGRLEVSCRVCGNLFWLNEHELRTWLGCPHCYGWLTLDPKR
jgi:hypothetical protein